MTIRAIPEILEAGFNSSPSLVDVARSTKRVYDLSTSLALSAARARAPAEVDLLCFVHLPEFHRDKVQAEAVRVALMRAAADCLQARGMFSTPKRARVIRVAVQSHRSGRSARAGLEPAIAPACARLLAGVLQELTTPRACPSCATHVGRCNRCDGRGFIDYSANARARALGVRRSSYRPQWEAPYICLLATLRQKCEVAVDEITKQLRRAR